MNLRIKREVDHEQEGREVGREEEDGMTQRSREGRENGTGSVSICSQCASPLTFSHVMYQGTLAQKGCGAWSSGTVQRPTRNHSHLATD